MPIRQNYPATVTLDANGAGEVQITVRGDFLLQGTRWVVGNGVTHTNQSAAMTRINSDEFEGTYSGNNDTSNGSQLMLAGDTFTCSWTGGDAGARAKVTIRGIEYNAGEGMAAASEGGPLGGGGGPGNPILGGETLIRNAIQSRNYVPGVDGWAIFANGNIDMNSGTFRGSLFVTDADGSSISITAGPGTPIVFTPPDAVGVTLDQPGSIRTDIQAVGGGRYAYMLFSTPEITFGGNDEGPAQMFLSTARTDGVPYTGFSTASAQLEVPDLLVDGEQLIAGEITNYTDSHRFMRGEQGTHTFNLVAVSSATFAVVFTNPFLTVPVCTPNIDNGAAGFARWQARCINPTVNGFTLFVFKGDAGDPAATGALNVQWRATV